jgi:predicted small secreted protein
MYYFYKILIIIKIFFLLSACNTVMGTFDGASKDIQSIWHYGSCVYEWESGCQKK